MISQKVTTLTKEITLLENVDITHVSLVDRPANRKSFSVVKRADKATPGTVQVNVDSSTKPTDTLAKQTDGEKPKGRWVTNSAGKRFFVPDRKQPRVNDKTGAKAMYRNRRRAGIKMTKPYL